MNTRGGETGGTYDFEEKVFKKKRGNITALFGSKKGLSSLLAKGGRKWITDSSKLSATKILWCETEKEEGRGKTVENVKAVGLRKNAS